MIASVLILALPTLAGAGEETRWYRVELKSGQDFTGRYMSDEKDFHVFSFQGETLRVAKNEVKSLTPLGRSPGTPAGASAAGEDPKGDGAEITAGDGPEPKRGKGLVTDDQLRDAIEELSAQNDDAVQSAYRLLSANFEDARPFIHLALSHQSSRVRKLSVKLLGEKGTAQDDLKWTVKMLSDDKPMVRLAAVLAIRTLGPDGYLELIKYLETEIEPNNRKLAVKTFQQWREVRAVAPLISRLQHEPDEGVRNFIAVALEFLTRKSLGTDANAWSEYLANDQEQKNLQKILEMEAASRRSGAEGAGEKVDVDSKQ